MEWFSQNMRVFFAITLNQALTKIIIDYIQALANRLATNYIRWTQAEHLHVTLYFILQVSRAQLQNASYRIEQTVGQIKPFTIFMDKLTAFPSLYQPRVIVLTLEAKPEIFKLHQLLGETFNREPELDFCPHITLGRIKSADKIHLPQNLPDIDANILVNKISLFESKPHAQGSEYIWQQDFILGK